MAEAKAEYAAAVQDKERRAKAYKVRLGSMDKAEYELATEVLKGIQAEGLDAFPEELVRKAEVLAPDYIAALRRERVVNNPDSRPGGPGCPFCTWKTASPRRSSAG